jgi:hypothetical protein
MQFMGDDYSPEEHGPNIVIQGGDHLTQITEIGVNEYSDILDHCELVERGGTSRYDGSKLRGYSDVLMTQKSAHMVDASLQKATNNVAKVIEWAVGG